MLLHLGMARTSIIKYGRPAVRGQPGEEESRVKGFHLTVVARLKSVGWG
jgi:hypothetical protein